MEVVTKSTKIKQVSSSSKSQERECLVQLKLRIAKDGYLESFSSLFSDQFLLSFVRGREFNIEGSLETLEKYIKVRKDYPNTFGDIRPSALLHILDTKMLQVLKYRDRKGRYVFIVKISRFNPDEVSIEEITKLTSIMLDEMLLEEEFSRNGLKLIYDMRGYTLKQSRVLTPHVIQKWINIFYISCPMRFEGIHLLHAPRIFNFVLKMIIMLGPKKLQENLHVHSNSTHDQDVFYENFPRSILPKFVGGYLEDEDAFLDLSDLKRKTSAKENYYRRFSECV